MTDDISVAHQPDRADQQAEPSDRREQLARLPQVDAALKHPAATTPVERFGRRRVVEALRDVLEDARQAILAGDEVPDVPSLLEDAGELLRTEAAAGLRQVVNATGVVLHTNLGRAPLSETTRRAVAAAAGYTNLEFDLQTGGRGSRTAHVGRLAARACGTEDATVVNNGAAALMLVLGAVAGRDEVLVSRGELIEIGGSYRLPDVMEAAGSRLVEVGTTNRTRTADYRAAAGEDTALLLKVHQSNYRMVGFASTAPADELAALARELDVPFVFDLGSGLLHADPDPGADGLLADEPSVADAVAAGTDLVLFSGDKLLGGPQAGIIAGREDLVAACRSHPLARAMRIDKLQRAALEATLQAHLDAGEGPAVQLPVVAMLHTPAERLQARAEELARHIGQAARPTHLRSVVGGGTSPGRELDSWGVALQTDDPGLLAGRLREQDPPVVGRVEDGRVVLDLRTVPPASDTDLADLVLAALG